MSGSSKTTYLTGIEASPVDHLLIGPRSSRRGFRTVSARYGDSGSAGPLKIPGSAWKKSPAGRAMIEMASGFRELVDGARALYFPSESRVEFALKLDSPKSEIQDIRSSVSHISAKHSVDHELRSEGGHTYVVFMDTMGSSSDEAMGRLYPARPHGVYDDPSVTDQHLVLPSSGSSGMRGARSPFPSTVFGPEAKPKPQYTRFGADDGHQTHRVNTPFFSYEGNAMGAAFLGLGALAVIYRATGRGPVF